MQIAVVRLVHDSSVDCFTDEEVGRAAWAFNCCASASGRRPIGKYLMAAFRTDDLNVIFCRHVKPLPDQLVEKMCEQDSATNTDLI